MILDMYFAIETCGGSRNSQTGGDGRKPLSLGQNPLFGKLFAKNCMKMKEFGQEDPSMKTNNFMMNLSSNLRKLSNIPFQNE